MRALLLITGLTFAYMWWITPTRTPITRPTAVILRPFPADLTGVGVEPYLRTARSITSHGLRPQAVI